jgi:hypothetical protein
MPLDGYETLGGYTMIGYLSVYVSRWALKPSRATLRRLLIRVLLSMGNETLQSYTLSIAFARSASYLSHGDYFPLVVSS